MITAGIILGILMIVSGIALFILNFFGEETKVAYWIGFIMVVIGIASLVVCLNIPTKEKIKKFKKEIEETKTDTDEARYKFKVKPAFEIPEQNIIVYEFEGSDGHTRYIAVSKTKITTINDKYTSGKSTETIPDEIIVDK